MSKGAARASRPRDHPPGLAGKAVPLGFTEFWTGEPSRLVDGNEPRLQRRTVRAYRDDCLKQVLRTLLGFFVPGKADDLNRGSPRCAPIRSQ